jgi:hypothetical protein
LGFTIFGGLVEMTALRLLYPSIAAAFQEVGQSLAPLDAARDEKFLDGLRAAAYGSIWLPYWFRSTRVQRVFTASQVEQAPGSVAGDSTATVGQLGRLLSIEDLRSRVTRIDAVRWKRLRVPWLIACVTLGGVVIRAFSISM